MLTFPFMKIMLEDNIREFLIAEGFSWQSIKDNGANLLYAYRRSDK